MNVFDFFSFVSPENIDQSILNMKDSFADFNEMFIFQKFPDRFNMFFIKLYPEDVREVISFPFGKIGFRNILLNFLWKKI